MASGIGIRSFVNLLHKESNGVIVTSEKAQRGLGRFLFFPPRLLDRTVLFLFFFFFFLSVGEIMIPGGRRRGKGEM